MNPDLPLLPKTEVVLKVDFEQRHNIGGQLFVSRGGITITNAAFGESQPGVAMATDTLMLWLSSGKPITAMAIALLYERQQLSLDDRVASIIPEFAVGGKEAITIEHLLTHTGGFRAADKLDPMLPWDEMIARICATPLEPTWVPGEKGGYHMASSWFILGEIIQRISGIAFEQFVHSEILLPCGMKNTCFSLNSPRVQFYGNKIGIMHSTAKNKVLTLPLENENGFARPRPGSSARGPISELARFYEMLLNDGAIGSRQILQPETIQLFTRRHRVGLYDQTFRHILDFGYGFIINSNRYGAETVPYGYGRYAPEQTYGHSGAESSCAFADPENEIIVAWVLNGMPGERVHNARAREINSAIYEDLRPISDLTG
jgi:CubicO group peptidase (beta-lactamase class C family)